MAVTSALAYTVGYLNLVTSWLRAPEINVTLAFIIGSHDGKTSFRTRSKST